MNDKPPCIKYIMDINIITIDLWLYFRELIMVHLLLI